MPSGFLAVWWRVGGLFRVSDTPTVKPSRGMGALLLLSVCPRYTGYEYYEYWESALAGVGVQGWVSACPRRR